MKIVKSKNTDGSISITVILDGRLSFDNVQQIKMSLTAKKITKNAVEILVFDFKAVEYMDTAGIGLLIFFTKLYPGKIRCQNISDNLLYVFELDESTRTLIAGK